MRELSVDIETFSPVDIKRAGGYRYAEEAEVMLFGYSIDHGPAECVDLMTECYYIPEELVVALFDPAVLKSAHNAAFERAVLGHHFRKLLESREAAYSKNTWGLIEKTGGHLPIEQWQCTQIMCARAAYPLDLDSASKALGTADKKDARGKALIRLFTVPCKPTKTNGMRERNLPEHFPQEWLEFIEYCKQDVKTEQAIANALSWNKTPEIENTYWHENEKMNEAGIRVDMELIEGAIHIDQKFRERLLEEAAELTGLENPNSRNQMLEWLNKQDEDLEAETLTKESVKDMLAEASDETVIRVLELRQELSKSSIKKYSAMAASVGHEGRIRGTVQFGGATRTFRNSGRIVQPQNLKRISMSEGDLLLARNLVKQKDGDMIELLFESVPSVLSELVRTAICARPGHRLLVADYSSIEARFAAWVAGEDWALDVFASHGKIYEATASRMFGVELSKITKDSPLRQQGKVASLALQYQGGENALTSMDYNKQIADEDKPKLVKLWRKANPNIVKMWYELDRAALASVENPGAVYKVGGKGLAFCTKKNVLLLRLPSGRLLHYPKPFLTVNRFGNQSIGFYGTDQKTRKWGKTETYGGKLFENICQAGSRDILMNGQHTAICFGYHPILNVHDEIVTEERYGFGSVEELSSLMCIKPEWAPDMPLKAEGFESEFYKK